MILNFLNSRFFLVLLFPFLLGALTVFSFQPFNYSYINFFIIPSLFLIGYLFGIGFFLTGTSWISHSLTFDENFKFLIPISLIGLPLFLGIFLA